MPNDYGLELGLFMVLSIYFYVWVNINFSGELILELHIIKSLVMLAPEVN